MFAKIIGLRPRSAMCLGFASLWFGAALHADPVTTMYEITSGTFSIVDTGLPFGADYPLPDESQRYIELMLDNDAGTGSMNILDAILNRWEAYDAVPGESGFPFQQGDLINDTLTFSGTHTSYSGTGPLEYSVSVQQNGIRIGGTFQLPGSNCFDCSTYLLHQAVTAQVVPEPSTLIILMSAGCVSILVARRRKDRIVRRVG